MKSVKILKTLEAFKIKGEILNKIESPILDLFEFKPQLGIKLSKVTSLKAELENELRCKVSFVFDSGIFYIGCSKDFTGEHGPSFIDGGDLVFKNKQLPIYLGINIHSKPIVVDLAKLPHVLIGGSTGSGKSVLLHNLILSLSNQKNVDELKVFLVDPKRLEFSFYQKLPHLATKIVNEGDECAKLLSWLIREMNARYSAFAKTGARNIQGYNQGRDSKYSYMVLVIDELADLILNNPELEKSLVCLAQKSRAAGIHIIAATQRPSVDVLTGLIKANFPARIALRCTSSYDSKVVLDKVGAEDLVGSGDLLYVSPENAETIRLHTEFLSDQDIIEKVKYMAFKNNGKQANYIDFESCVSSEEEIYWSIITDSPDDEIRANVVELSQKFGRSSKDIRRIIDDIIKNFPSRKANISESPKVVPIHPIEEKTGGERKENEKRSCNLFSFFK